MLECGLPRRLALSRGQVVVDPVVDVAVLVLSRIPASGLHGEGQVLCGLGQVLRVVEGEAGHDETDHPVGHVGEGTVQIAIRSTLDLREHRLFRAGLRLLLHRRNHLWLQDEAGMGGKVGEVDVLSRRGPNGEGRARCESNGGGGQDVSPESAHVLFLQPGEPANRSPRGTVEP